MGYNNIMKKILLVLINSLTINAIQAQEIVLNTIDISKTQNNPLLIASIDQVIKAKNPDLHYQKSSYQHFYWIFLSPHLETIISTIICQLVFKTIKDKDGNIVPDTDGNTVVDFLGKKYKKESIRIIDNIIDMISLLRLVIYIYKISKNKLFNPMNTTMILLNVPFFIFFVLLFFLDKNLLQNQKNNIFICITFLMFISSISLFILSIIGIRKKFKIDDEYKDEIKLYKNEIWAQYNKNLKESNRDHNPWNKNLVQ
jgi:hypothetical protein